ncbi:MAG: glycosyltransferase family 4 protein [Patescibacteria group bacterium]
MRIAIFHELQQGGARRAVNEFAKELQKKHTVDLYIVDIKEDSAERAFFHQVHLYPFTPKDWRGGNWRLKLYKDTLELMKLYQLHKKMAADINNGEYDVAFIHPSQYTQAPFILRFLKTRKVYYCEEPLRLVYESQFEIPKNIPLIKKIYEKFNRLLRKRIDRENLKKADMVITNSKYTKKRIEEAYKIKSVVSYLGVDTHLFRPLAQKKEYDILFIGAKTEDDGYILLREIEGELPREISIKKHIIGEDWIEDETQFVKLYNKAKLVVCLSHDDPFGLIPLEAMACGIPVVAVNEGGYLETILHNNTGYLLPRNGSIIAKKITSLLRNEAITKQLGRNAREHVVENWTMEKSTKQIERHLR